MNFTGFNLVLVRQALSRAISDVEAEIGSCPDTTLFADEIEDLDRDKYFFQRLLRRVDKAIAKGVDP